MDTFNVVEFGGLSEKQLKMYEVQRLIKCLLNKEEITIRKKCKPHELIMFDIIKREECVACDGNGRGYWSDGISGKCIECGGKGYFKKDKDNYINYLEEEIEALTNELKVAQNKIDQK